MGKYHRNKQVNIPGVLFFLLFLGMILYAGWKLSGIRRMYAVGRENYGSLAEQYVASSAEADRETEAASTEETDPKEYAPIQVDFDRLREAGPEIIGWLYSADTPINYPLVQHKDNDYYLDRLPDGTYSAGGSIFMECTNSPGFCDLNNIFYGHNMKDGSMFGTLTKYRDQSYYDEHPSMYLLTPETDFRIDLIGGYTTISTSDTYRIPIHEEEWAELVQKAAGHSQFQPVHNAQPGERLITLSTCSYDYDEARFVLVGVLRELDRREEGGTYA